MLYQGEVAMRPARIIAAVFITAAVAATGSYLALSTATQQSAVPQPQGPPHFCTRRSPGYSRGLDPTCRLRPPARRVASR
jgi:hypothetical protein